MLAKVKAKSPAHWQGLRAMLLKDLWGVVDYPGYTYLEDLMCWAIGIASSDESCRQIELYLGSRCQQHISRPFQIEWYAQIQWGDLPFVTLIRELGDGPIQALQNLVDTLIATVDN